MSNRIRSHAAALLLAAVAAVPSIGAAPAALATPAEAEPIEAADIAAPAGIMQVMMKDGEGVRCRPATLEEQASIRAVSETREAIMNETAGKQGGLKIVLVPEPQVSESVRNAFLRAAAEWESRITTPITIVIRVDFGTTRFGEPYGQNVLGSTDPQYHLTDPNLLSLFNYSPVRSLIVSSASTPAETALYNALPTTSVPTTNGNLTTLAVPTALRRALRFPNFPANADPNADYLPSVGFNSRFAYDFDPSNGIDFNKTDFHSTAVHEIGHVLGFNSSVGYLELDPDAPTFSDILDLFRFRPGVTTATFATAERVLASGGTQVFFAGGPQIGFSTGRITGEGGDGEQAGHWKEGFAGSSNYIGIMDPVISDGELTPITASDLAAFETMGYSLEARAPITFGSLAALLRGDVLTLSGTATSTAGPVREVQVSLLDEAGGVLTTYPRMAVSLSGSGAFSFEVEGLALEPAAVTARVTLLDDRGNSSNATEIGFGAAESGAPLVEKLKRKNANLTLTGTGFSRAVQLEVNGVTIALPGNAKVSANGNKLKVKTTAIGLQSGANRLRVILNGRYSNIVVVTL